MAEELRINVSSNVSEAKQGIDDVGKSVDNLNQKVKDAKKTQQDFGSESKKTTRELIDQISKLSGAERSITNYRRQLSQMSKDIQDLTVNYRAMSDADKNSQLGKETLQRINELTKKAAEYKDAVMDAQNAVKNVASDTANWDAARQGLDALSSSLQTIVSLGVLGADSTEELVRVIAKLKAIETATAAAIKITTALQKDSALMLGVQRIQTLALTKAKELETVATGKATIAQKLFNTVAKANPYVLLATAILAVGTSLVLFMRRTNEAAESQKNYNNKLKEAQSTAAANISKFALLQTQYKQLKTEAEKTEWIKANTDKFNDLGLSINSVADAQKILIDRAADFIKVLQLEAEASALNSYYEEEYKKGIEKSIKAQKEKGSTRGSNLGTRKDWEKAGLIEGVDYKNMATVAPPVPGAVQIADWQLTQSGKEKMEKYGEDCGKAVMEGTSKSLQPIAKLMLDKQKEAADIRESLGQGKTNTEDKPKPKPEPKKQEERDLVSQLAILKQRKGELENELQYIEDGGDAWKKQLDDIVAIEKQIKELEAAVDGYKKRIANPLEPLQKIDSSKLQGKVEQKIYNADEKQELYNKNRGRASELTEQVKIGAISVKDAQKEIDTLNAQLKNAGLSVQVGLELDVDEDKVEEKVESLQEKLGTIGDVFAAPIHSINNLKNSFEEMMETLEDPDTDSWEKFFAIFQTGETVLSSVSTILGVVQTVTDMLNHSKQKNVIVTQQETQATIQSAAASQAATAPKMAEGIASGIAATTKGGESVASIPYVGAFLAVAMIATIAGTIAGIIGMLKGFADGGVVGGHSYSGDKILARLNSGELILNQKQQSSLLNQIDSSSNVSNTFAASINIPSEITLTAKGTDLQTVITNVIKKQDMI